VRELREADVDANGVVADLTDPTAAEEVVAAATNRWRRLDILVNNAGMVSVSDRHALSGGECVWGQRRPGRGGRVCVTPRVGKSARAR
jgi:NADP-dependent 3-hydroxy acid dehydrogenase YdfG